jgi:hypothetical protein
MTLGGLLVSTNDRLQSGIVSTLKPEVFGALIFCRIPGEKKAETAF